MLHNIAHLVAPAPLDLVDFIFVHHTTRGLVMVSG